jgi:hypothetical protein
MIRLALFDLGDTLIHDHAALPHARDALQAIRRFALADGSSLPIGIVSDDALPPPPLSEAEIVASEARFQESLAATGLRDLFDPFARCVTTATRAGVNKPDRRIFERAVQRSGVAASLGECLFVTEHSGHLAACQNLGMRVLRFGSGPGIQPAFADWRHAPLLIAAMIGTAPADNQRAAVRFFLETAHGLRGFEGTWAGTTLRGQSQRLVELQDPQLGPIDGLAVEVPVDVSVTLRPDGDVAQVQAASPSSEDLSDAVLFVKSLWHNQQVALPNEPPGKATHVIAVDADGKRRLVRRRYSFR